MPKPNSLTYRTRGHPTKLTPAIQTAIINAVAGGVPYVRAAALADIKADTALEWLARGAGTDKRSAAPLYAHFAQEIEKAKSQDEARRVLRINQAGQGGVVVYEKTTTYPDGRVVHEVKRTSPEWTADAWHLERSQPDVWGRRERLEHTGSQGGPLQIQVVYEDEQVPVAEIQPAVRLLIKEG